MHSAMLPERPAIDVEQTRRPTALGSVLDGSHISATPTGSRGQTHGHVRPIGPARADLVISP